MTFPEWIRSAEGAELVEDALARLPGSRNHICRTLENITLKAYQAGREEGLEEAQRIINKALAKT